MEIKLNNIKYRNIFEDLDIEIKDSKITSIIGKNGSGKSILLNLLSVLYTDFDGEILIDKKVINSKTNNKHIKRIQEDIFYLRQNYEEYLFNTNVFEDIKSGFFNIDLSKLEELLKLFDLKEEILKNSFLDLSSGELKKILIIKMFIINSKILLLDDPTRDLDQKSVLNLIKLLKREKHNGKIIIIASADTEFLLKISDQIIIIDNGKVYESKDKYNVFSNISLLNRLHLNMPSVLDFKLKANSMKKIKLVYRDNINDLIKDIYRNVQAK